MITGISSAASLAALLIRSRSAAGGGKRAPFVDKKMPQEVEPVGARDTGNAGEAGYIVDQPDRLHCYFFRTVMAIFFPS